jgi:predicted amidohydrolase
MRVAVAQLASPLDEAVHDRLARVGDLIAGLTDVDLVVLPELWASGYFAFDRYRELAEGLDGPLLTEIAGWARQLGTHVQAGSVLERDEAGRLYNTAVLLGPDGRVLLDYRKVHVFGYQSLEAQLLTGGDRAEVAATACGRVGMTTCYDLRFPELYRVLVDGGAELLIVPAAWPAARLEHWRLLTRARAVENEVFLIACNAAGAQGDVQLGGHSVVVDPWGRVVAEAGQHEEILYADIDLQAVADIRAEFPVLRDRRLSVPATFR